MKFLMLWVFIVTVSAVEEEIDSAGGSTYVRWGRKDCGAETEMLYSGTDWFSI